MSEQQPDMTPGERERFEREVIQHEPPNAPVGPASENEVAPTRPEPIVEQFQGGENPRGGA